MRYYQLRAKSMSAISYLRLAEKLQAAYPQMHILANDFAKTALSHPQLFYGLHLGQEDLRELSRSDRKTKEALYNLSHETKTFILGLSTHKASHIRSALRVEQPIAWDYIALGPCFATSSKTQESRPLYTPSVSSVPSDTSPAISSVISSVDFTEALNSLLAQEHQIEKKIEQKSSSKSKQNPPTLVLIGGIRTKNIRSLLQRPAIAKTVNSFRIVAAAIQAAEEKEEIDQILKFLSAL